MPNNGSARPRALEYFAFGFAVFVLLFAIGMWLGLSFIWPARIGAMPGLDQLGAVNAARDAQNQALQAHIDALKAGLQGNICLVDPKLIGPGGIDHKAPVSPGNLPPPKQGENKPKFKGDLADLLDQATVMVIAPSATNSHEFEQGSGFFISSSLIMTNDHVIAGAIPNQILIFNDKMPKPLVAQLLASTGTEATGGPDFAVLRVAPQPAIQPLALTSAVTQLQPVTAAGFPAAEESSDQKYEALLHGDLSSGVPSVDLTDGEISAIQTSELGSKILPHTAQISKCNSGGPLVDQCGRVVGIDTFEGVYTDEAVHLNYALEAADVARFLNSKQVDEPLLSDACSGAQPASPGGQGAPPS